MDIPQLLAIARQTIAQVPLCMAVTVAENGEAHARVVQPGPLREDWSVGFMTERYCRKVQEMQRTGRLTLAYQCDAQKAYVSLSGRPVVMDDVALKRATWSPASDLFHPGGPDDPNVVVVRLLVDCIEIYNASQGIQPSPVGLNAAVLRRAGSGWQLENSTQRPQA